MTRRGCLISVEGIDGSGKSEQTRRLVGRLKKRGFKVLATREPTKVYPAGKLLQRVLRGELKVSEEAVALLFAADRVDHTLRRIRPALEDGAVVVSDRYVHSSLAYQGRGMAKELDLEWLREINRFALEPDAVVFLDLPPEAALGRLHRGQVRIEDHTYFDGLAQQHRIREAYLEVLNLEDRPFGEERSHVSVSGSSRVFRVDGSLTVEQVEREVWRRVKALLGELGVAPGSQGSSFKPLSEFTG